MTGSEKREIEEGDRRRRTEAQGGWTIISAQRHHRCHSCQMFVMSGRRSAGLERNDDEMR
jgi:L-amino acid N-acyltransferase YncA